MADDLSIKIAIHGATRIANKYRSAAARHPSFIDPVVEDWAWKQTRKLATKKYPPERPGQTYIRTYTLPTGWLVERTKEASYTVTNTIEYAHWVVSKKYQAWMHKGRWWTAEDVMAEDRKTLTKDILKAAKDILS